MTAEQFTYWLQGFFEMGDPKTLTEQQVKMIKDHLALVFTKVTPYYGEVTPSWAPNWQTPPQPTTPFNGDNTIMC